MNAADASPPRDTVRRGLWVVVFAISFACV